MNVNKVEREALEDLISSEGWAIYKRLVEELYNPAVLQNDIVKVTGLSKDLAHMGAAVASLVVGHETAALVIRVPETVLEQGDEQEAQHAKANRR